MKAKNRPIFSLGMPSILLRLTLFTSILFSLVLVSCASRQTTVPLEPGDELERATAYFENKRYENAAKSFEKIIFYYPSSEYVDDAQFWLGRSYFGEKDYDQAIIEFDYLIKNFSNSLFVEDAYFYRAQAYILKTPGYTKDQTELNMALNLLDEFLTRYPNSQRTAEVRELILTARDRLAKKELENGKLYVKLNKLDAALIYFEFVIQTYPETKSSNEAKYQMAKIFEKKGKPEAALALYKELLEDETWMKEAEKRIKKIEKDG